MEKLFDSHGRKIVAAAYIGYNYRLIPPTFRRLNSETNMSNLLSAEIS